ncbi:TerB family tellurite resistance protein [Corallococcus exercitus]|uniref:TerB family tellurite resistance protein n=1 Tax=Corallococcus exercitus TaxID=2316736 RepID=UPI0035D426C2
MFRSDVPAKKASDDVLLLHTMLLMSGADGFLDQAEVEAVEAYFTQLPEFEGKQFQDVYAEAKKLVARYSNLRESVKALSGFSSEKVRKKAFVLAADLAMASGDVSESEDELLTAMQRVLEIDDGTVQKVLDVLAMKYAR